MTDAQIQVLQIISAIAAVGLALLMAFWQIADFILWRGIRAFLAMMGFLALAVYLTFRTFAVADIPIMTVDVIRGGATISFTVAVVFWFLWGVRFVWIKARETAALRSIEASINQNQEQSDATKSSRNGQ